MTDLEPQEEDVLKRILDEMAGADQDSHVRSLR
jgi:hypothetical protein